MEELPDLISIAIRHYNLENDCLSEKIDMAERIMQSVDGFIE